MLIQTFGGVGEMFEELDSDGNGVLLREEFFDGIRKVLLRGRPYY
jgi:Ca2+-binding EF-hand superfamily protein